MEEMFDAVARIVRVVDVPVTADLEHGYRLPPEELIRRLAETGAVGCNLEDSDPTTGELVEPQPHADYLSAVRGAAERAGIDLVLNARADTRVPAGASNGLLDQLIDRCRRYRQAGADCVFPIFADPSVVSEIVQAVDAPIAVLYRSGSPTLAELARLGVARVSYGPGLHRAAGAFLSRMLRAIREGGDPYES
jgi:2-methylisocitrate lyase-like PEP mutase family enzyme